MGQRGAELIGHLLPDLAGRVLAAPSTFAIAGLRPFMGVRDHQRDAPEAAEQALEEGRLRKVDQNGSVSEGPRPRPTSSRRPSASTATAIIAATETIRPPP